MPAFFPSDDEISFLQRLLESPGNTEVIREYSDWLEVRGKARSEFLRLTLRHREFGFTKRMPSRPNLSNSRWPMPYWLSHAKRVRELRSKMDALSAQIDPGWLAFVKIFGESFREASLVDVPKGVMPFFDTIGFQGPLVTFENCWRGVQYTPGLLADLQFVCDLPLGDCWYGASDCPVHAFMSACRAERWPLTGKDVLQGLSIRGFSSRYISSLDATSIPYPGYHPGHRTMTIENDEIHNDFIEQSIFFVDLENGPDAWLHGHIKQYMRGQQLWYVLKHMDRAERRALAPESLNYVALFAVGLSPTGDRLVGVMSSQNCHNFCD